LWIPPAVVGTVALREPSAAVAARLQARRDAGLDPEGLGYPSMRLWVLVVLPAAVLAALCLVALIVSGTAVWGVAGAAAALTAGAATGYLVRDGLRMTSGERRELVANRSWHSDQPWSGALAQTPERRLVAQAQDAVALLVGAPAWASSAFEEHRLRLDLKAELGEIDRQAFQLAATSVDDRGPVTAPARTQSPDQGPPSAAAHASARAALARRVDALSAYARAVAALPSDSAPALTQANDGDQLHRALTATVRDEFATDRWTSLRQQLPIDRPKGTA
jgi:hypothetical protein